MLLGGSSPEEIQRYRDTERQRDKETERHRDSGAERERERARRKGVVGGRWSATPAKGRATAPPHVHRPCTYTSATATTTAATATHNTHTRARTHACAPFNSSQPSPRFGCAVLVHARLFFQPRFNLALNGGAGGALDMAGTVLEVSVARLQGPESLHPVRAEARLRVVVRQDHAAQDVHLGRGSVCVWVGGRGANVACKKVEQRSVRKGRAKKSCKGGYKKGRVEGASRRGG